MVSPESGLTRRATFAGSLGASALAFLVLGVPGSGAFPEVNDAPNPPVLLAPSNGSTLHRQANQPFSISAVDPNGDPYTGMVIVKDGVGNEVSRFPTSPAPSGTVSYGLLTTRLTPGDYNWTAEATDVHGAVSDLAVPRSFTVNPPPSAGGGAVEGTVDFGAAGVPSAVCEPTSSTWHLVSPALVFNTAIVGYAGAFAMEGSGSSACESVRSGEGTVNLAAAGSGPLASTLSCTLSGSYTRVGSVMALLLSGSCEINQNPISRVSVYASLGFVPVAADLGTTSRVHQSVVGGDLVVVPE